MSAVSNWQIQSRSDEIAKWEKELSEARKQYKLAVDAPHVPGCVGSEIQAVADASERISHAKFKLEWLEWVDRTDEERWRHETDVQF